MADTGAGPAKRKRKKLNEEQKKAKRDSDRVRAKTRVNLGRSFRRWRELRDSGGFKTDAELALFLLDSFADCTCKSRMCSVVGCDSWRRSAQQFKLPEDPERRMEWVQFLFEANGQRLKESSWTDISICSEHFVGGCFVNTRAVPSLCITSEPDEPEPYQTMSTDDHSTMTDVSEIVTVIKEESVTDEESDPMDEMEESGDEGDTDSDEDWNPPEELLQAKKLRNDESDEENETSDYPPLAPKDSELCTDCGQLFNKQKPHICEHKIKPYSCNICGKRCVSEVALTRHSRIHDENYEHRCKYCHITLKTKVDKHTHEQTHLSERKPYKCPDCSEAFAKNKQRRLHVEEHRGPRQCHICGIKFLWPLSLQRHLAVHTGERPFKCTVCERGFNQAGHLKSHMRLHTGERPFKCQHCDKCFNHNVSLKSHVQRYHSASSGCERKKEKINERESGTDDVEGTNKNGADSVLDNAEKKRVTEEEEQEIVYKPKYKKISTGRPIGRPKRNAAGNLGLTKEMQQCANTKIAQSKGQKLKKTGTDDEECEDKQSDDVSFGLAAAEEEEEEEKKEAVKKSAGKSRGRPKHNTDNDFNPKERTKKKRYSSQSSRGSSGKRRGRPKKSLAVRNE